MKTVLITGGARGIGRELSIAFAKAGYLTVINYNKSEEQSKRLTQELTAQNLTACRIRADVSKSGEVKDMFDKIYSDFGKVDVLINNAGVSLIKEFADTSEEDWDFVLNANLKSAFLCGKHAAGGMLKLGKGRIINIASVWGLCGASCEVAYSASKAGLIGFTKALAKEFAPNGITVNAIAPGFIDTEMNAALSAEARNSFLKEIPIPRAGLAQEVAATALFLASDEAAYITGQTISVDGGLSI